MLTVSRKAFDDRTILVVYGGPGEHHELAVSNGGKASIIEGADVEIGQKSGTTVLNWDVSAERRIVNLGCGLSVYILGKLTDRAGGPRR